jgi:hypothetical protein
MAGRLGILDAKGPVAVRGPTKTRPKKTMPWKTVRKASCDPGLRQQNQHKLTTKTAFDHCVGVEPCDVRDLCTMTSKAHGLPSSSFTPNSRS